MRGFINEKPTKLNEGIKYSVVRERMQNIDGVFSPIHEKMGAAAQFIWCINPRGSFKT
jgi:hypothetical protein